MVPNNSGNYWDFHDNEITDGVRAAEYFDLRDLPSIGIQFIDGANHNLVYRNLTSDVDTDVIIYGALTPFVALGVMFPKTFENVVIANPGQQVVENLEGDEDPSFGNVLIGIKPVDEAGTALLNDVLKNAGPITEPTVEDFSRVFFTHLSAGLNMIDIPLKPITSYTARSLAESLGATVVIRLNADRQRFEGFTISDAGNGFPIEGGNGYIANVTESKTVSFVGAAWTNNPPVEAAPTLEANSAWAFVVSGNLNLPNDKPNFDGYTIQARNFRTGAITTDLVSSSGYFDLASADLSRQSIIQAGDRLEIIARDASGEVVSKVIRTIDADNIGKAYLNVPLRLGDIVPSQTVLLQNYPNPFNPETWIPYQIQEPADVAIRIYDTKGQLVRTLDLGQHDAGFYIGQTRAAHWNGHNDAGEKVASGLYFYQIKAGDFSATRRMLIVK